MSTFSQVSQRRQRKVQVDTCDAAYGVQPPGEERAKRVHSDSCYKCNIKVNLEDITTYAICRACDQTVCRSKVCSDWDRTTGYWECLACINNRDGQVRAGEWILDQLNRRFKRSNTTTASASASAANPQDDTVASQRDVETRK